MSIKKIGFLTTILVVATIVLGGCSNSEQNTTSNLEVRGENNPPQTTETGERTVVYFFWGDGCPHCDKQKPWLEELEEKYSDLEVKMYETWKNRDNAEIFQEMAQAYGTQARGVPVTFIGDFDPIVGFNESMKPAMEERIETCLKDGCIDPVSKL